MSCIIADVDHCVCKCVPCILNGGEWMVSQYGDDEEAVDISQGNL